MSNMVVLGAFEFRVSRDFLVADCRAASRTRDESAMAARAAAQIFADGLVSAGFRVSPMKKKLLSRGVTFTCELERNVADFCVFISERDEKALAVGVFVGQVAKARARDDHVEIDVVWPKVAAVVRRTLTEGFAGDHAFELFNEEWVAVDADG